LERYKNAYVEETKLFIESIQNNTHVLCAGNDGLQAQLIAKAAQTSYEEGRPVKLN